MFMYLQNFLLGAYSCLMHRAIFLCEINRAWGEIQSLYLTLHLGPFWTLQILNLDLKLKRGRAYALNSLCVLLTLFY